MGFDAVKLKLQAVVSHWSLHWGPLEEQAVLFYANRYLQPLVHLFASILWKL